MPSFTQLEFRNILPDTDESFIAYDANDGFRLFKEVQDGIAIYFKEITEATPPSDLLQFAGSATVLGSTTVKLENVTVLNANQTVNGSTYTISKIGNSDFTTIGAFDNTPGVVFTATGVSSGTGKVVSNVIQDESIVAGRLYKILFLGTTNWNTAAGTTGVTYKVGDWIVAAVNGAGAGAGTGTVASDFSYLTSQVGQIIKVGSTWARINKFIDEQTIQVDRPVTAGAVYVPRYYPDVLLDTIIGKVTAELSQANLVAGNFVVGKEYIIVSLGDTAWNTAAGTTGITYAVGDSFKAAAVGSGTGIAAPKYVVLTQTAFDIIGASVDKYYEIAALGSTNWNSIAGTTGITYAVGNVIKIVNQNIIATGTGSTVKRAYPAKPITAGKTYQIVELGATNWNTVAGTTGVSYVVGSEFRVVSVPTTGNGIVSFYNIERYYENITEIAQGDTTIAGTYIGEPRLDSAGILYTWNGSTWVAASLNSRVVDLTATSQVFTYDSAGTSPTPGSVTLTATASNTSGTVFYDFLVNDVSQQNTTTNTYVLTAPGSIANTKVEVRIREGTNTSAILARDQTSVIGIRPGTNGNNAISALLTNEAHTLPTTNAGVVTYTGSGTTILAYEGATALTYAASGNSTFSVTAAVGTGTITIGTQTNNTFAQHSSMTTDNATITYTVTIRSSTGATSTITKTQSLAKSIQGTNGSAGTNAVSALLTNEAHTLPTTNAGVVTYTGSGTTILAYEGATALTYAASGNSTFSVTAAVGTGTITIGTQTNNTFAQHSSMTTDNATITYTVTIRSSTGATSTITKTQSLAKSIQGTNGTDGLNNATVTLFAKNTSPSSPPGAFTGTFRYTFSSNALTVVSGSLNGWSTAAPSLSTGEYLWARSATFSANTATADRTDAQFTTAVIVGGAGRNPGRVSNFVENGLYWTTAFGGTPSTVGDPTQTTYVDVAGVGRVARVNLSSGNIYFQTKELISPQVGRKYRVRVRAVVNQNATGGTLRVGFYINGLNSSYAHTDPAAASDVGAATVDRNRVLTDTNFVVADGVVDFGAIFTCTGKSASSAYWRPRFDMERTGGSGGIIDIYEFTIEEIVSFTTDVFQIFNNVTDVPVFDVTGSQIRMTADLNVSSGITVGAARLKVGLESIRKTGVDGAAITWADGVSIGSIPEYVLDLSNLAPLTTGEAYSVLLTGVTATGATVYAKIITPGTTSTVSNSTDAAGGTGNPTRVMQKNDVADAYDNVYNFNIQCNAIQSSVFDSEVGWLTSYSVDVTPFFNNGSGWSAGTPVNFSNYYTTINNETGNPVGVGDIFPISWTNPIGNGGAGNLDFGISITGGSGNSLLLANVSYTKQTSSGLRTASPAGQTVKIAAFPRNA